jgi:hypothetical protein
MAKVIARDGKVRLLDNADKDVLAIGTLAVSTLVAPTTVASNTAGVNAGYTLKTQADAIAFAVKKLVAIVKNQGLAT